MTRLPGPLVLKGENNLGKGTTMTASIVRLTVGALVLAGATAGAAGAPQPSAVAARVSGSLTGPAYVAAAAALCVVLVLLAKRLNVVAPAYAGKHRA